MEPGSIDYRYKARCALDRSKAELATNDDGRLPYAVLELRFAMESITYDRAQAFKSDLPYKEYGTWQPRKLVAVMADIDPRIMRSSTIRIGRQEEQGKVSTNMRTLGTEFVLSSEDIKEHYNSLGGRLHIPTMAQFQKGKIPDPETTRAECEEVVAIIERVFSSNIWNPTTGTISTIQCEKCNANVHRRLPPGATTINAECFECKAEYTIEVSDGQTTWFPKTLEAPCANPNCTGSMHLWPDQVKAGTFWTCKECGGIAEIQLRVGVKDSDS
jgi:hypothetical protein